MNSRAQIDKLVRKRKLTASSIVGVTLLFLALINAGSYFFVRQTGEYLEKSLDERLQTSASFASQLIENEAVDFYDPLSQPLLRLALSRIHAQSNLEAAYIIAPTLEVIADSRPEISMRGYVREDSLAIRQALEGSIATSQLHRIAGSNFKNVYSPLFDLDGNNALLVLEANAEFLDVLSTFNKGLFAGLVISAGLLVVITIYLVLATRSLIRTERAMQQSRRLAAMGQMGATMAHEIRNPLGIIKSTADVLREKYQDADKPDELFNFINEETMRLNRLVNDFLSLSRDPVLRLDKYCLNDIIAGAVAQVQSQGGNHINIAFSAEERLDIACDKDLLHQTILNLLLNAQQAIGDKKGEINISLKKERVRLKNFVTIEIRDNGPGFAGDPAQAFEPFYTTKTSGTGLGLAVSKTLIEKHGGSIRAENSPKGGAVIQISLPM